MKEPHNPDRLRVIIELQLIFTTSFLPLTSFRRSCSSPDRIPSKPPPNSSVGGGRIPSSMSFGTILEYFAAPIRSSGTTGNFGPTGGNPGARQPPVQQCSFILDAISKCSDAVSDGGLTLKRAALQCVSHDRNKLYTGCLLDGLWRPEKRHDPRLALVDITRRGTNCCHTKLTRSA